MSKMVEKKKKCPNCKSEIEYILEVDMKVQYWDWSRKSGQNELEKDKKFFEVSHQEYRCPKCNILLTDDIEKAIKYLGGW
jgi:transposase-like protein